MYQATSRDRAGETLTAPPPPARPEQPRARRIDCDDTGERRVAAGPARGGGLRDPERWGRGADHT